MLRVMKDFAMIVSPLLKVGRRRRRNGTILAVDIDATDVPFLEIVQARSGPTDLAARRSGRATLTWIKTREMSAGQRSPSYFFTIASEGGFSRNCAGLNTNWSNATPSMPA